MDEQQSAAISGRLLSAIRYRVFPSQVDITREWIKQRLDSGKCEATGIEFDIQRPWNPRTPSIDRIDSSKGYCEENCQLVILQYNLAKNIWSNREFFELARKIGTDNRLFARACLIDLKAALSNLGAGRKFDDYWANVENWLDG
jgi:hypothetical protein